MLRWEIDNRTQGKDENFVTYLSAMKRLFKCLNAPLSDSDQLYAVRKGLTYSYAMGIATAEVNNLDQLIVLCKRIDNTRILVERQKHMYVPRSSLLEPDYAAPQKHPRQVNELELEEPEESCESQLCAFHRQKSKPSRVPKKETGSDKTVEERKLNTVKCWNCDSDGHSFRECTAPRTGMFCYRCGAKHQTAPNCESCTSKEKETENETVEST